MESSGKIRGSTVVRIAMQDICAAGNTVKRRDAKKKSKHDGKYDTPTAGGRGEESI